MIFPKGLKKYFWLIPACLFACPASQSYAASPDSLWVQGNHYYSQKLYDTALRYYRQIEVKGLDNAALFYNMGNTYYRLGNTAKSVLYYERALFRDPQNKTIKDNLSLAQARVQLPMTPKTPVFFISWWQAFLQYVSPIIWATIMLLCFLVGLWYIYKNIKRGGLSQFAGRWLALVASGFIISGLFFYFSYHVRAYSNKAVVMIDNTPFYSHKGDTDAVGQLPEGSVVKIKLEKEGWYDVNLPNGSRAWVSVNSLEKVQP